MTKTINKGKGNTIWVHKTQWDEMKKIAKKTIIDWNKHWAISNITVAEPSDEDVEEYAKRMISGMYGNVLNREIVIVE